MLTLSLLCKVVCSFGRGWNFFQVLMYHFDITLLKINKFTFQRNMIYSVNWDLLAPKQNLMSHYDVHPDGSVQIHRRTDGWKCGIIHLSLAFTSRHQCIFYTVYISLKKLPLILSADSSKKKRLGVSQMKDWHSELIIADLHVWVGRKLLRWWRQWGAWSGPRPHACTSRSRKNS